MKSAFLGLISILVISTNSHGDSQNLEGGVLILHHVTGYAGRYWYQCDTYWEDPIYNCEEQDNRIDVSDGETSFYVLAVFPEDKQWCEVQFGFGDYPANLFFLLDWAACDADFESSSSGWPGPLQGTTITAVSPWEGKVVPVYGFRAYSYYEDVIGSLQLIPDPTVGIPFAGFTNCAVPPETFDAAALGAMGFNQPGTWVCADFVCCLEEACVIVHSTEECADLGGDSRIDLTSCDPDPCSNLPYACCTDDACELRTEDDCLSSGGAWRQGVAWCDPNPCVPQNYTISADGTGDLPTIQVAILASVDGSTIDLLDGVYSGPGNSNLDFLGKAVTVQSVSGNPASCVIDCQNARGFRFESGEGPLSVLRGVSVINGFADFGAGVLCSNGSAPSLDNCEFSGHRAIESGGAVACLDSSYVSSATACVFRDNEAGASGGAVYCISPSEWSFVDCVFDGNQSVDSGGAIYLRYADVEVLECSFTSNESSTHGGGAYIRDGIATVTDSEFVENEAQRDGGGLWAVYEPVITRCQFIGNKNYISTAAGAGAYLLEGDVIDCDFDGNISLGSGGGLSISDGQISGSTMVRNRAEAGGGLFGYRNSVDDCSFVSNTATSRGGGLFGALGTTLTNSEFRGNIGSSGGGACLSQSSPDEISFCTFVDNTASDPGGDGGGGLLATYSSSLISQCTFAENRSMSGHGGGISYLSTSGSMWIQNSIIAFSEQGNALHCLGEATPDLDCSDIYGNADGNWVECIVDQLGSDGNIEADPLFCGASNLPAPYSLNGSSPCAEGNSSCGQIGAWEVGCGAADVFETLAPVVEGIDSVHPNPFLESTTIRYSVLDTSPTSLTVHDIAGRTVRVLIEDAAQEPGQYQVEWDGRDGDGHGVASGIYFCRMETGMRRSVRRLLVMK